MVTKTKINQIFLYLLIVSSPFINFSVIPNSNLPVTYLVTILYCFSSLCFSLPVSSRLIRREDYIYAGFLISMLFSVLINSFGGVNFASVTQLINLLLTYLIFKVTENAFYFSSLDKKSLFSTWFEYNSWVCLAALFLFLLGIFDENIVRFFFNFFNNSGNFSKGGLIASFTEDAHARLNSFAPEPSFWGFFTAFNFALGVSMKKKNYFFLVITFVSLLLTVSRTGYLMVAGLLFIFLWNRINLFFKFFLVVGFTIGIVTYSSYIDFSSLMEVDDSFKQRFGSLAVGFKLFSEHPIFGIGIGNFQIIAKEMGLDFVDIFSLFVNIMLAGGILSISFLLIFCKRIFNKLDLEYKSTWILILIGWLTVSSYNLPYVWIFIGVALCVPRVDLVK